MIWIIILILLIFIAPDFIILLGAMIIIAIIGIFELIVHLLGLVHDEKDDEKDDQ